MKYIKLLEEYLAGAALLEDRLSGFSEADLAYRPARPGAWTIAEHVIHLADSEANALIRCKSIIAQPNAECFVMDEEAWTANLARKKEDVKKYLELFKLVRSIVFDLLKDEPEENWNKNGFSRRYKNETRLITIEKFVELYRNHVAFHLEYIDKIRAELEAGKSRA
jgi:hypothetical protein